MTQFKGAFGEDIPSLPGYPNIQQNVNDRRQIAKPARQAEYADRLERAVAHRDHILVRSDVPPFGNPTIYWAGGVAARNGPEFVHLDTYDQKRGELIRRAVPWDWIMEIRFLRERT